MLEAAKKMSDDIAYWRRELHKIPETGLFLPKTSAFVLKKLMEWGIECQTYQGHSGITAVIGKKEGRTIALRADMDALMIKEEANIPFKSLNDNMHACGHDAHTAILLGAAKILQEHENALNGKVKLIFQPAEEGPGGALPMIEDGALNGVDAILGMHVTRGEYPSAGSLKNGDILAKYGNSSAADDQVDITIIGKGGHGSTPDLCVDPVTISSLLINAIQLIISREISPFTPCVITFGSVNIGRGAENIIADRAELRGTIRNQDLETRDFVFRRIEEVTKYITKAMRADYILRFRDGYPPTKNDDKIVDGFLASARSIFDKDEVKIFKEDIMGGDDAGFFYQRVPGCYFNLYSQLAHDDGIIYPAHNSKFLIDDSVLYKGSAAFAKAAIDYLMC